MIAFFRSILNSKLIMGLFALIMLAFVVTGVGTGSGGLSNLAGGGTRLATVGNKVISEDEAVSTVRSQFEAARQQKPGLDIKQFIASGAVDQVIDQMINGSAMEAFGANHGMIASDRLVDGEIASIPAFHGPTGSFDRNTYLALLSQRKLTERGVREDLGRSKIASMLVIPAGGAARVPTGLIAPYASLLLEAREGQIAAIPANALVSSAAPSDAELKTFYDRNVARYTVPETRIVRYAVFDRKRFEAASAATDAEIAAAYKSKANEYAGKETRVFTQVIVPDEKSATALAAKVRAGTPIIAAAKAAGTEATTLAAQDKPGFASLSSSAVANAAFSAKAGDTLSPGKTALGWFVIHVDKINQIAGKSLTDVRAVLATDIAKGKTERLVADFVTKLDDEVADRKSFDDIIKAEGLTLQTTPSITASGIAPAEPAFKASAGLVPIIRDAFLAETDDDAAVITLVPGESYAFYDLESINPASPKALAQIKAQVAEDFKADRANRAAKQLAETVATAVRNGTGLTQALAATGKPLPSPRPVAAKRLELAQMQGKVPAPLALMFGMARNSAKVLEMPDKQGWFVIKLDRIIPGSAATQPDLMAATAQQMSQVIGEEYASQFVSAIKNDLGVKRNADAIARLKKSLSGSASQ